MFIKCKFVMIFDKKFVCFFKFVYLFYYLENNEKINEVG